MVKKVLFEVEEPLLETFDAWAKSAGMTRAAALRRLMEEASDGKGSAPAPRPKGCTVPAMDMRAAAEPKAAVAVKASPHRAAAAREALAQAEANAAHLATPKAAGRVSMSAAMDKAGMSGFGERPAYGSRLKGAGKPPAPKRR